MAHVLDRAVWSAICQMMTEPERLLSALDEQIKSKDNEGIRKQIAFLERQVNACKAEDDKLYRAFVADIFDEQEYAEKRNTLKEKTTNLEKELEGMRLRAVSLEETEADKALIRALAEQAHKMGVVDNASFEFKRRIIKLLVDKIVLNVRDGWFRMEGSISRIWLINREDSSALPHPSYPSSNDAIEAQDHGSVGNGSVPTRKHAHPLP